VTRYVDFFKVPLTRIIVVHDDLDMKPGRLKLVSGGGTGGHNGIRSIVDHLGGNGFYRLKIGIGRPGSGDVHPDIPVDKYVLTSFQDDEMNVIQNRIKEILKGLELFFSDDVPGAMNFLNSCK
jgi:PTH1 family peptidyl-tRNA hydrolase